MALLGQLYHVGIVVPDIEAGKARFSDLLGISWGPVVHTESIELRDGEGNELVFPNTLCYSTEPPYIELVLEVPGSVWECNEHSNLHHIGVWSDDLHAETSKYSNDLVCPLQLCGRDADGALQQFAYHRDPLGVRIELVDASMKPMMEEFMFKAPVT
jgi:catechol 2,3-dioxygenase-like lactoylglutathione lyase family enzyme